MDKLKVVMMIISSACSGISIGLLITGFSDNDSGDYTSNSDDNCRNNAGNRPKQRILQKLLFGFNIGWIIAEILAVLFVRDI